MYLYLIPNFEIKKNQGLLSAELNEWKKRLDSKHNFVQLQNTRDKKIQKLLEKTNNNNSRSLEWPLTFH